MGRLRVAFYRCAFCRHTYGPEPFDGPDPPVINCDGCGTNVPVDYTTTRPAPEPEDPEPIDFEGTPI